MEKVKNIFPNARMQVIQNAGHLIHLEQPQKLCKMIVEFIND